VNRDCDESRNCKRIVARPTSVAGDRERLSSHVVEIVKAPVCVSFSEPDKIGDRMNFSEFEQQRRFMEAWQAVRIARGVPYSLFTFGESELPYFLVCNGKRPEGTVSITRGEVRVTRPMIITPDTVQPEFSNFFEAGDDDWVANFLIARTAAFSNLRFENDHSPARIVTDSVEEAVARLNRQKTAWQSFVRRHPWPALPSFAMRPNVSSRARRKTSRSCASGVSCHERRARSRVAMSRQRSTVRAYFLPKQ
jgi:hypothetical protein